MSKFTSSSTFSDESRVLQSKLHQSLSELSFLKQELLSKDQKLVQYEREIQKLRDEKDLLLLQQVRSEKAWNTTRLSSYSQATNNLLEKLSNPNSEVCINKPQQIKSFDPPEEKQNKTFYNGIYFKKNKENPMKEDLLKRKNSDLSDFYAEKGSQSPIFENFAIISSTRDFFEKTLFSLHEDSFDSISMKTSILPPSTVFSYPQMEPSSPIKKTIENYAFPFGVKAENLCLDESYSQLNQILFSSNNLLDQRNNCFSFVIKTEESYNKMNFHHNKSLYEGISNFTFSNYSKDSADDFAKLNQLELLELCNSNNFLYVFGLKTMDFIEAKGLKGKVSKEKRFWAIEKAYCFISKYPFMKLFIEAILQILNIIKIRKMKLQLEQNAESFSKIDTDFLMNFFEKDLTKLLDFLLNSSQKSLFFDNLLEFQDQKFPFELSFRIPDFTKSFYLESDWNASLALSNLSPEVFSFVFLSILLENSMVFFSESLGLLTSSLMLFVNLIQPFKWHSPVVFNLPNELFQILESPVPIIVGINREKGFIEGFYQKYSNIIFVSLDNLKIYNKNLMKEHMNDDFFTKLTAIFRGFQEKFHEKKYGSLQKELIGNPSFEQREACFWLFKGISGFLEHKLVKLIPEKALYAVNGKNLLNYEMIRGQMKNKGRENRFLERFVDTQMLTFFLDEFYWK